MANSAFLERFIIPWTVITINTVGEQNKGYFANSAGTLTVSLPATSLVGDVFEVSGYVGLFQITQAAAQQVRFGVLQSTLGAGGSVTSTVVGDSISLRCTVADTVWQVVNAVGIHNVV